MDKGQGSGQLVQNLDKIQGFEVQSVQNPDIGEGLDYCTLPANPHRKVGTEGQSIQKGSENQKANLFFHPRTNSR